MSNRKTRILTVIVAVIALPASAQTQPVQIELLKPERCAAKGLQSVEPVRCFAWATATESGNIDDAEARCTKPDFVPFAKTCLNNHRLKKEHRGSETKVCVEFTYLFGEPDMYFGARMQSSVNRTRVLPNCEMPVAPS